MPPQVTLPQISFSQLVKELIINTQKQKQPKNYEHIEPQPY